MDEKQVEALQAYVRVLSDARTNLEFQLLQLNKEVERLKQFEPKPDQKPDLKVVKEAAE